MKSIKFILLILLICYSLNLKANDFYKKAQEYIKIENYTEAIKT